MVSGLGRRRVGAMVFAVISVVAVSSAADAQTMQSSAQSSVGFMGGVSIDPEQVFAGVFWESPPIASRFHIRPGIDGGFGEDLRVATLNIDFVARFPLGNSPWRLIQGGGPVIVITKVPDLDLSDTSAGFSYIFGFAHERGFFGEFRLGGGNVPMLKIGAGYQLRF